MLEKYKDTKENSIDGNGRQSIQGKKFSECGKSTQGSYI